MIYQLFTARKEKFIKDLATPAGDLLWLQVFDFKKRSLPSWLSLSNLRYMYLGNAVNIRDIWPNTDNGPPLQLRELRITNGHILQRIPTSIGHLKQLKSIKINGCKALKNLPEEFCCLSSLEWLDLRGCEMLSSLPRPFGDLKKLRHVDLTNCKRLQILPVSFKQLTHLHYLNLNFCEQLSFRLDMLESMKKLEHLYFSFCSKLVNLPNGITDQVYLRDLYVSYTGLREVPTNIGQLQKLETLEIGSDFLKSVPAAIGNLRSLRTLGIRCDFVTSFPLSLENLSRLTHLELRGAMLTSVPDFLPRLNMLKKIKISGTLVSGISLSEDFCPCLETLILYQNYDLLYIGSLPTSLQVIEVWKCRSLKKIEGISGLINLKSLRIDECTGLEEPISFVDLHSIQDITIFKCDKFLKAVTQIQSWEDMEKLRRLEVGAIDKSALQPCIQAIKKWPRQTCIVGKAASNVESEIDCLSFPNLTVIRGREGLLECGKTHSSDDVAIVCILVNMFGTDFMDNLFLPFLENRELGSYMTRGKWLFVCVLRRGCGLMDTLDDIVRRKGKVKSGDEVVGEEKRVVLIVGEEGRVEAAFKNLWPLFM